jgi:hypothetical protein
MRGTGRISVMSGSAPLRHTRAAGPLRATMPAARSHRRPHWDAGHPDIAPALDGWTWKWSLGHTWGMCHRTTAVSNRPLRKLNS